MMKGTKRMWGLGVAAAFLLALPAEADAQAHLGVSGGVSLPIGDFSDIADTGFNINGYGQFRLAGMPQLAIRGEVGFHRFGTDFDDENWSILSFTGNGVYFVSPMVYLIGGVGLFRSEFGGEDETDFGIRLGAGTQFLVGTLNAFLEANYRHVFTDFDDIQFIPISAGIKIPL